MTRGAAITVGVTRTDPAAYGNATLECPNCAKDADAIETIVSGFAPITSLRGTSATTNNVKEALAAADSTLGDGDYLVLYFSCHGSQVTVDGTTELGLALYDRLLLNGELIQAWAAFQRALRIFLVVDACESGNAGGMGNRFKPTLSAQLPFGDLFDSPVTPTGLSFDFPRLPIHNRWLSRDNKWLAIDYSQLAPQKMTFYRDLFSRLRLLATRIGDMKPSIVLLSACQANEAAHGAQPASGLSAFTQFLVKIWNESPQEFHDYYDFTDKIRQALAGWQHPKLAFEGTDDFRDTKPFTP
jgi:hypothetical protein